MTKPNNNIIRLPAPVESDWMVALRRAVKHAGIKSVCSRLGYSRTAISLVLNYKYKRNIKNIEKTVRTKLMGYPVHYIAVAELLESARAEINGANRPSTMNDIINDLEAALLTSKAGD